MYLAPVHENKFIGSQFNPDAVTDLMLAEAAAENVSFVLIDALLSLNVKGEYGSPTAEQLEATRILFANKTHQTYLDSTDWYVLRKVETGTVIPAEVLTKRAEARTALGR